VVSAFLGEPTGAPVDAGLGGTPGLRAAAQTVLRLPLDNKLEAIEEALVAEAMSLAEGNKSAAARLLGVHRKAVSRRVEAPGTGPISEAGQDPGPNSGDLPALDGNGRS